MAIHKCKTKPWKKSSRQRRRQRTLSRQARESRASREKMKRLEEKNKVEIWKKKEWKSVKKWWPALINFFKLNIEENPEATQRLNIASVPTILFFRGPKIVDMVVGLLPLNPLTEKWKNLSQRNKKLA